jgi:hypothetical protein
MPLQKQAISIGFGKGMDTKTDPYQVSVGKFLSFKNIVFDKVGRLTKRNGFGVKSSLPNNNASFLTTFNGNLTAVGTSLQAYSEGTNIWSNKGNIQPAKLNVLPLIRNSSNQSQSDTAIASNGLICTVYTEKSPSKSYKYVVSDSKTGQNIIEPVIIPVTSGAVTGSPRVFLLGRYFIIVFNNVISATNHLQYIAINTADPTIFTANADITAAHNPSTTGNWDGVVVGNNLYIAYNNTSGGQSIKVTYLSSALIVVSPVSFASRIATIMSLTSDMTDPTNPVIWVSFYDLPSTTTYALAIDKNLNTILIPTLIFNSGTALNLASTAQNGSLTLILENANNYAYDSAIPSHYVTYIFCTQAGALSSGFFSARSVGLASKAFLLNGVTYYLGTYSSPYQSSYFLFNLSGNVIGKLAYSNGGGYYVTGIPSVTVSGNICSISYLVKDLISAVNKDTNVAAGTQVNGIYSQTGINLANFTIGTSNISVSEIGKNLNLSGAILLSYDGFTPVEQNFNLWPDSVEVSTATGSGSLAAATYFYQATYEWSDNNGSVFRSAASIPVSQVTTTASSTNTIYVPTLRLTYKITNPVKIVLYRWSTLQQVYYQVTSLTSPTLNDTTIDYVTTTDTFSDATILGNNILYTNGGVVENIGPPAADNVFLFDDRLWLIPSEDPNLLWYSKQVIENTPVEMSDLFTTFVAPTTSAQGSSGDLQFGVPMDDKAILFKEDAIYYINGTGPDNTGSNNGYGQPTFITATVGSDNQRSVVFIPNGLMFQSDKGIWLLGRDLSTKYIGADVEAFNSSRVVSTVSIPGTNQVRFDLDSGITLMYDYYVEQWGIFEGLGSISSTLYKGLHTNLNKLGQVFQETPNRYIDGSNPVLVSFVTAWFNLAGLQGYQRAYFFYLLGTYISPHKLSVQVAFDYSSSPLQQSIIKPNNFSAAYGIDNPYGNGSTYGGALSLEQWKISLVRQTCASIQLSVNEIFDSSFGTIPGEGLTLSGISCAIGVKKGYKPISLSAV